MWACDADRNLETFIFVTAQTQQSHSGNNHFQGDLKHIGNSKQYLP
jgi:hypothetical protein